MRPLTIAVHDGTFHTDDVFACATLTLVFKDREVNVVRTRDESKIAIADVVIDVGGVHDVASFRFDHHQQGGAGKRDNGIPYASFGLVWKEYGHVLAGSIESANFIDEQLVQGIDGADNGVVDRVSDKGVYMYSIIDMISAMRPTWQEKASLDQAFSNAVTMAVHILERVISHTAAFDTAKELLEKAYADASDKQVINIGREYPGWYEAMASHPEPLFVVYEREDGNWTAKSVRVNPMEFQARRLFPERWAGLRGASLAEVSGVLDAIFCHNGRFIAVAKSRQGAIQLAKGAIAA